MEISELIAGAITADEMWNVDKINGVIDRGTGETEVAWTVKVRR
jgi:hypothetical protein